MTFIPQFEPLIKEDYANAVRDQVLSGWVGPGTKTVEFEEKLCELTGAKYCISTVNGTTAILIALKSFNLEYGETPFRPRIAFPSYTFLAGANAAKFLNYNVELADIKRSTMSMDPDLFRPADAMIYVNHNAYVGEDVLKIKRLCEQHKMPMIEDSSQALGMPNAGRIGDIGIFSFSVPKIITTGQGGAIITDHLELAERCRQIRDHGDNWRQTKIHKELGVNFKFNDIAASLGLAQLQILNNLLEERARVFDCYRKHIPLIDFGYPSTWMVIHQSNQPDKLIAELKKESIQAVKYYKPLSDNPPYATGLEYDEARFVSDNYVYLPSSLGLTNEQIKKICGIIENL